MENKTIVIVVIVVAVLVGLPLAAKLKQNNAGNTGATLQTLQQEYDQIRTQGLPLTLEELDAWYERPADNAADLYLRAFDSHVELPPQLKSKVPYEGDGKLPPAGQPLSEAMRQAIQEYVWLNNNSIILLQQAAARPQCRYPIDLRKGMAVELPHLAKIRGAARLLAVQAVFFADIGNPDGSVESMVEIFRLANSLQNEPSLISHLVRIACARIGIDALKWAAARAPFNDAQSARLSSALDPFSNESTFWRGLAGDRCIMIGCLDARIGPGPGAFPTGGNSDMEAVKKHIESAVFEKDMAYCLHVLDLAIQAEKLPPDEGRGKAQEALKLAEEAPSDYLITRTMGVPVLGAFKSREAVMAESRTAAETLGVKRH